MDEYNMADYWRVSKNGVDVRANSAVEATRLFLERSKARSFEVRRYINGRHQVRFDLVERTMVSDGHHNFKSRAEAKAFVAKGESND